MKVTLKEYLMGRESLHKSEITDDKLAAAEDLLGRVNTLLELFGEYRRVTSGWRPMIVNAVTTGAAKKSNHMYMKAVDLEDHDGGLDDWCMDHQDILEQLGLWMEHPSATKNWCHLQSVPPRSGKRVFYP